MAWSRNEFRERYGRLARFYDPAMWLYRLAGMRIDAYRRAAVERLRLEPGATVVDLACGTGLNFPHLETAVGPTGRIIGVDLTPAMLAQADKRARHCGWNNIELINADISQYRFPAEADAVLATLALGVVPDYDAILARAAGSLRKGARIADFELKWPERWPRWLARLAARLNRPAGVTPDIVDRNPSRAIRRWFSSVQYAEVYFGAAYICSGSVPD